MWQGSSGRKPGKYFICLTKWQRSHRYVAWDEQTSAWAHACVLNTRLLPRPGQVRGFQLEMWGEWLWYPARAGEEGGKECWVLPTCGPLASVSCRTLSPRRWPLSWSCSVPPHWCSPLRHQPAAWKAGSLLYLPLRSAQEREEKETVRHACHSLTTTCRAESAFLLKEMGLPAPNSALWLRNVVSLCQPTSSKVRPCLPYVSYGWKQGISSQISYAKKHWFE